MNSNAKGQLCCVVAAFLMLVLGVDWFIHVHNSLAPGPEPGRRHRWRGNQGQDFPVKIGNGGDGLPWGAHPGDGSLSWLYTCGWIDKKWGDVSGAKTAMAPKLLRLQWNENSIAQGHEIYEAYSPVPFQPGKENFVKVVSTLRGDHLPAAFQAREYNRLGYYRFKVVPVFFEGRVKGPASPILELVLIQKRPLTQLSPGWVGHPCWNSGNRKDIAGPSSAAVPQRLWLDWLDLEDATAYRVYTAYSPTPFLAGKENYQLLLTTKISAYHSSDPRYLTGAARRYTKPGYYRFKVVAVSNTGIQSQPSEVQELTLK